MGNVQLYGGRPLLGPLNKPAIDPDCCCHDSCPFLMIAISLTKANAGEWSIILNEGTALEYTFPGSTNTNQPEKCGGHAWISLPDPGAAPPPIDLCTISGYFSGVKLACCGAQTGYCCSDDVYVPPDFLHCDGGADHGRGTWPAPGYDSTTLNGDPDHDCPIVGKGSNPQSYCYEPADGTPPDGREATGNCMEDVSVSWIHGAGDFIDPDGTILGGCNTLTFTGSRASSLAPAATVSIWGLILDGGVYYLRDNFHINPCTGFPGYWWGGFTLATDGTSIGEFLPSGCGLAP